MRLQKETARERTIGIVRTDGLGMQTVPTMLAPSGCLCVKSEYSVKLNPLSWSRPGAVRFATSILKRQTHPRS